jgi:hypothetical protein
MTITRASVFKQTCKVLAASVVIALQAGSASAVSFAVQRACMADYFAYCSSHSVGSASLRRCMSDAGPRLSKRCVNALIDAGEVSKSEVARREASRR